MININLDKCGGLTEALAIEAEAKLQGMRVMLGCMLGSSLAQDAAQHLQYSQGQVSWVPLAGAPLNANGGV